MFIAIYARVATKEQIDKEDYPDDEAEKPEHQEGQNPEPSNQSRA